MFDQGLGRSFWFVNGGNPELIAQTIHSFPDSRQADFWSGIGLAAMDDQPSGKLLARVIRAADRLRVAPGAAKVAIDELAARRAGQRSVSPEPSAQQPQLHASCSPPGPSGSPRDGASAPRLNATE